MSAEGLKSWMSGQKVVNQKFWQNSLFITTEVAPFGDVVIWLSCSDDSPLYSEVCFVVLKLPDVFGKFGAVGVLFVLK